MIQMKQMNHIFAICLLLLLSFGCSTKVDGSSEEAFKTSVSKMKEGLSEEDSKEFTEALVVIAMKDLNLGAIMAGTQDGDTVASDMRRSLDGKSREEILTWANEIRAQRQAEKEKLEKEQLLAEIEAATQAVAELKSAKEKAEAAKVGLSNFKIKSASFEQRKRPYISRKQPIINLEVVNSTGVAVSRAYFRGVLKSPGREIAWLDEDFNYEISGGLEPGESAKWSLEPNMFSEWGSVDAPNDAILLLTVTRLDGPNEEPIFDSSEWDAEQDERLEKLLKFLSENKAK